MKIVKIAKHCCIRVQKEALPLLAKGYDVHLITERIPRFGDYYKTVMQYFTPAQMYQSIKAHSDADIFHVHNEPSWFVTMVKELFPDKPVVLDVHDSLLGRLDAGCEGVRISVDERNNFVLADAHVFVSESLKRVCQKDFGLEQPSAILPSYVPARFYCFDAWRWLGGVVYEGRIDLPEKIERNASVRFFSYCDYTDMAEALTNEGIGFYFYAGQKENEDFQAHYGDTATYKGGYVFEDMIRRVARHDWGLVGNIENHPAWNVALPNKLFEYMAAGIPVVVFNASECAEFVKEHGVGIVVRSVKEFKERWKEKRKCRENVIKKRRQFAMENHISRVEDLYRELV
jgi:glycosyltransferase involved in cell wall biosynthesis